MMKFPSIVVVVLMVLAEGCRMGGDRIVEMGVPPTVDGARALALVGELMECGPRISGEAGAVCAQQFIEGELAALGIETRRWEWEQETPRGTVAMVNVGGRLAAGGGDRPVILLAGHYDSKWFGPESTFVGANDGGSSTGLLLEMGRVLAARSEELPWMIWLLFFDGEECVESYGPGDGLYGSLHFARWLSEQPWLERVQAAVVLDMVGDRDLSITLPRDTPAWMARGLFESAERLGVRREFGYASGAILDDHVPLAALGIPAVDVIDFEFGDAPGRNNYWHTGEDTLDKLSAESLATVGNVVLDFLWGME